MRFTSSSGANVLAVQQAVWDLQLIMRLAHEDRRTTETDGAPAPERGLTVDRPSECAWNVLTVCR